MNKIDSRFIEFDISDPNAVTGDDISISTTNSDKLDSPGTVYSQQDGAPTIMAQDSTAIVTHSSLIGKEGYANFQVLEMVDGETQNTTDIIAYADKDKWDFENVQGTAANIEIMTSTADGSIYSDDCSTYSGWSEGISNGSAGQISFAGEDTIRTVSNSGWTTIEKDLGNFTDRATLSFRLYTTNMTSLADARYMNIILQGSTNQIGIRFGEDEVQMLTNTADWIQRVTYDTDGRWTEVTLDWDVIGNTVDLYLNNEKVVDSLAVSGSGSYNNGEIRFQHCGYTGTTIAYIDWIRLGANDIYPANSAHFEDASNDIVSAGINIESNTAHLNDDCTSLTGWTNDKVIAATTETFETRSCFRLQTTSASSSDSGIDRDFGTSAFGSEIVIQADIYSSFTNAASAFTIFPSISGYQFIVLLRSDGSLKTWQTSAYIDTGIRFYMNTWNNWIYKFNTINRTVDIYLNKIKVGSNIDCAYSGGYTAGPVNFTMYKGNYADVETTYLDNIKIGDELIYTSRTEPKIQAGCQFKITGDSNIYQISSVANDSINDTDVSINCDRVGGTYALDWIRGNDIITTDKLTMLGNLNVLIDYYEDHGTSYGVRAGASGVGESFSLFQTQNITKIGVRLWKAGAPTGNAVIGIYNITGTVGTNAYPTGSAISTSLPIDVATFPLNNYDGEWFYFEFLTPVNLSAGDYAFVLEYSGGSSGNQVEIEIKTNGTYSNGNVCRYTGSWTTVATTDVAFRLYGGYSCPIDQYYTATTNDSGQVDISTWSDLNYGEIDEEGLKETGYLTITGNGSDASTDFTDISTNSHGSMSPYNNIQVDTAQADPFGNHDGVIQFDGSGSHLQYEDINTDVCTGTNNSVDFWVRLNNTSGSIEFCKHTRTAGGNYLWAMSNGSPRGLVFACLENQIMDNAQIQLYSGVYITDNDWHHIAAIKCGDDWGLYLDGTQISHQNTSFTTTFDGPLTLGNGGQTTNGNMYGYRIILGKNYFNAAPNAGETDTIDVPIAPIENELITNYYSISTDARDSYKVFNQTESVWRDIAKDNSGTWQYNNATDATSEVWVDSDTNSVQSAISQAVEAQEANRMIGSEYEAISDEEWNDPNGWVSSQTTLDLAITQTSQSNSYTPTVGDFTANYDIDGAYELQRMVDDYKIVRLTDTTTKFTKVSAGSSSAYCTVII